MVVLLWGTRGQVICFITCQISSERASGSSVGHKNIFRQGQGYITDLTDSLGTFRLRLGQEEIGL